MLRPQVSSCLPRQAVSIAWSSTCIAAHPRWGLPPTLYSPCSPLCRCPTPPDPIPTGAKTCLLKGGLWYRQPKGRSGTMCSCASASVAFAPQGWWECRGWRWSAMSPSWTQSPFSRASPSPACLCTRLCSPPLPRFGVHGVGGTAGLTMQWEPGAASQPKQRLSLGEAPGLGAKQAKTCNDDDNNNKNNNNF